MGTYVNVGGSQESNHTLLPFQILTCESIHSTLGGGVKILNYFVGKTRLKNVTDPTFTLPMQSQVKQLENCSLLAGKKLTL
jgi:hypothetical protein